MAAKVGETIAYKMARVRAHLSQPSEREKVRMRKWERKNYLEMWYFFLYKRGQWTLSLLLESL